ncbi:hypothetical protein MKW94_030197 [Papaver nudicaule]|uniref:RING-type E3 ubiquitin transferase n=1 Tax=Papaver nudicaule TaxID=74823 RepID=A0AA42AQV6_PAPNU|nr:hypothetical protein [Papaver nudicaule]
MEDYRNRVTILILILFLIIVLVVVLHFYAKWYWSRRIGTQTGTRRRRFVFTPSTLEQNITIRQGLAASVMRALPVVTFSANEFKDGLECAVCLSEVQEGEKARVLPKCSHGFHVDCIHMWFQSHSTCPLCRNPVSIESASPDSSQEVAQSVPITAENDNSNNGLSIEAPTNVMFWGNQTHISIRDSGPDQEEEETSSDSSSPASLLRPDRALIIDIPQRKRVVPSSPGGDIEQGEVAVGSSKMSPAGFVIGSSTTG